MPALLNEGVIKQVRDVLEAELPGVIDEINAEQTNPDHPIDHPANVYSYVPPIALQTAFPWVGISDGQILFEDDTGDQATARFTLGIVAMIRGLDQERLAWQLRRYAQAIVKVLARNRTQLDGWGLIVRTVDPGPALAREENPDTIHTSIVVVIELREEQDW